MRTVTLPARQVPLIADTDVLVVGGGPAGIMAAVAAARNGARTMLVERAGYLGGNLTIHLPLLTFHDANGDKVIRGLAEEFVERLRERGSASEDVDCPLTMSFTLIDIEAAKAVAWEMVREAGVDVRLHTFFTDVLRDGDRIEAALLSSKSGLEAARAKVYIDCSGDGDVAARAGVPFQIGRESDHRTQPGTLVFRMGTVDTERLRHAMIEEPERYRADEVPASYYEEHERYLVVGLREVVEQGKRERGYQFPVERLCLATLLGEGEVHINMARTWGNWTNAEDLTRAEAETRQHIPALVDWLQRYVPGFESARVMDVIPYVGLRESRRIQGEYVLTEDDVMERFRFPDAIMACGYPLDMHSPGGDSDDSWFEFPQGYYQIPYRCLVPQKIGNLLVAGRCISVTHEALAAVRVMIPCMAMGEAAGTAASMAISAGTSPRDVDTSVLRRRLEQQGMFIPPY
jgi:hypothetical protein